LTDRSISEIDVAIIGAGAAGCFAAANMLPVNGRKVVIFEKTGKVLQKVRVSGGGRCNVTHQLSDITELITKYPRGKQFLKKTLHQFSPADTIDWFQSRGVPLKTEEDGRMFPVTDNSETIIDCIWKQVMKNKVEVKYHKSVQRIEPADGGFTLHFADGSTIKTRKVLITCGGFPKEEQFNWIKELGHTIQPPVPSLFTFNVKAESGGKHPITELMGVSVPVVKIKVLGTKMAEQGPILVTHWGFSGPVVLRASAWGARVLHDLNYVFRIQVNWLNEITETDLRETIAELRKERGKGMVFQKNPFELPRRLWEYLLSESGISENIRWGELSASSQNKLIANLTGHTFKVHGKTTFKEEFVTAGGITLNEVSPETMESRKLPGLYFAGEILDVDGITGGFNFQHAWASGMIAAKSISSLI
jgi:predicted Rossmann fold flavoprotein